MTERKFTPENESKVTNLLVEILEIMGEEELPKFSFDSVISEEHNLRFKGQLLILEVEEEQ